MATQRQKQELGEKVPYLVGSKFGGDDSISFRHYANCDGKVGARGIR